MGSDFDLTSWCENFIINTSGIDIIRPSYSKFTKSLGLFQITTKDVYEQNFVKKLNNMLTGHTPIVEDKQDTLNKKRDHKLDLLIIDQNDDHHILKDIRTNKEDMFTEVDHPFK